MDNFKFNLLSRSQFDSVSISSSQLYSKYYHAMKFFWRRNFCHCRSDVLQNSVKYGFRIVCFVSWNNIRWSHSQKHRSLIFFGSLAYNANCQANHFPVAQMDHWNVLEYFTFASEREIFSAANGLV